MGNRTRSQPASNHWQEPRMKHMSQLQNASFAIGSIVAICGHRGGRRGDAPEITCPQESSRPKATQPQYKALPRKTETHTKCHVAHDNQPLSREPIATRRQEFLCPAEAIRATIVQTT
jgi:hypothetical protein